MSAPVLTLQFVDSIASSPTVLFDLNDRSLTFVTEDGWSAPPPQLQRSSSASSAYDGSRVAQSSYMDRDITITVAIASSSQDASATAIQAIGRLLNSDGQWLKLSTGTTNPVFFRTKRAEIDQIAEFNGQSDGLRTATLTIPAEPFAYGLPESGSATVANDPTAGTNPMSFVFPTVKGDVASPLSVSLAGTKGYETCLLSSSAAADAPSAPINIRTITTDQAAAGWSAVGSTSGDATAFGGTTQTFIKTSGALSKGAQWTFAGLVPGDYRIVARVKTSAAGSTIAGQRSDLSGALPVGRSVINDNKWHYYDLGVSRMPNVAPAAIPAGLPFTQPTTCAYSTAVTIAGSSGTVAINGLIAVPANLDDAQFSSLLLGGNSSENGLGTDTVYIDPFTDSMWRGAAGSSSFTVPIAGGMPAVVPGVKNVVTLVQALSLANVEDQISSGLTFAYLYYPRYLYVRPATT